MVAGRDHRRPDFERPPRAARGYVAPATFVPAAVTAASSPATLAPDAARLLVRPLPSRLRPPPSRPPSTRARRRGAAAAPAPPSSADVELVGRRSANPPPRRSPRRAADPPSTSLVARRVRRIASPVDASRAAAPRRGASVAPLAAPPGAALRPRPSPARSGRPGSQPVPTSSGRGGGPSWKAAPAPVVFAAARGRQAPGLRRALVALARKDPVGGRGAACRAAAGRRRRGRGGVVVRPHRARVGTSRDRHRTASRACSRCRGGAHGATRRSTSAASRSGSPSCSPASGAGLAVRARGKVTGRRRRVRALAALPASEPLTRGRAQAGARLEPSLVYRALPYAVAPEWTRGHVFTVAQEILELAPRAWYVTARDGVPLHVAEHVAGAAADATVTMTRGAFDRLLAATQPPRASARASAATTRGRGAQALDGPRAAGS